MSWMCHSPQILFYLIHPIFLFICSPVFTVSHVLRHSSSLAGWQVGRGAPQQQQPNTATYGAHIADEVQTVRDDQRRKVEK